MRLSILDLAHVPLGSSISDALRNTLALARLADTLGYERFWLAEHHNMPGIASAATSVVIGQVAAATQRIRVGAGGIMLPNHSPLVIAEQFGTLEALFPGRIDLGLGRAPGTDGMTWRALRREPGASERFPEDVLELQALLGPVQPGQRIRAVPGADTNVPLWILGSSLFGAQLAAQFGLPYAFASHFAPAALHAGAEGLPRTLPAVGAIAEVLRNGWRECDRRTDRRRGTRAFHLAAAGGDRPGHRQSRSAGATRAANRAVVAAGATTGRFLPGLLVRRLPGNREAGT